MKTKITLGVLTILAAIPSLFFVLVFTLIDNASIVNLFVLEKLIIVFSCLVGGLLLLKGNIWGQKLSVLGWLFILFESARSLYVAFQPDTNEAMRMSMFIKDGLFMLLGIPVVIILFRNIMVNKNA